MIKIIKESNQSLCDKVRQIRDDKDLFNGPLFDYEGGVGFEDVYPVDYTDFAFYHDILKDHGIKFLDSDDNIPSTKWTRLADKAYNLLVVHDSLTEGINDKFANAIENLSDEKVAKYLLADKNAYVAGSEFACLKAALKYPDVFGYNNSEISYLRKLDTMQSKILNYDPDEDEEFQKLKELIANKEEKQILDQQSRMKLFGSNPKGGVEIPYGYTGIGSWAFLDAKSLTSVTIPDSVTEINVGAFNGCENLINVNIPNSVTGIGYGAFEGCTSLKSVTIPNSVGTISFDTFKGCTSLKSVTIPNSVGTISSEAFEGCTSLKSIIISNSVTRIADSVFRYCKSLTDVYYTGTREEWEQIQINKNGNDELMKARIHYNA